MVLSGSELQPTEEKDIFHAVFVSEDSGATLSTFVLNCNVMEHMSMHSKKQMAISCISAEIKNWWKLKPLILGCKKDPR